MCVFVMYVNRGRCNEGKLPPWCVIRHRRSVCVYPQEVIVSSQCGSARSFLELLLPALLSLLQTPDLGAGDELLQRHCARAGRALDLLLDILYSTHSASVCSLPSLFIRLELPFMFPCL